MDCFRGHEEMFEAKIPPTDAIGIFQANNCRLKELFTPSPKRCLAESST